MAEARVDQLVHAVLVLEPDKVGSRVECAFQKLLRLPQVFALLEPFLPAGKMKTQFCVRHGHAPDIRGARQKRRGQYAFSLRKKHKLGIGAHSVRQGHVRIHIKVGASDYDICHGNPCRINAVPGRKFMGKMEERRNRFNDFNYMIRATCKINSDGTSVHQQLSS